MDEILDLTFTLQSGNNLGVGYSRKNPHPPTDGTLEILAGGGVEGSENPRGRGGLDLKILLRGSFSPCSFRSLTLQNLFDRSEKKTEVTWRINCCRFMC